MAPYINGFWDSVVSNILLQKPPSLFDLIANQACYTSWHVLSYFYELTKLNFL